MNYCIACTMPLSKEEYLGAKTKEGDACVFCTDEKGNIKTCDEIFEGGVEFFLNLTGGKDRGLAERLTRRNMKTLPYWAKHGTKILDGAIATDEEHETMMNSLQKMGA